ncbi:MAG: hypothetical protein AAGF81_01290 [Pseudomonadota bacterium]
MTRDEINTCERRELDELRSSAQALRDRAKAARLDFVAYLAEMTVLEIDQEIERRSQDGTHEDS